MSGFIDTHNHSLPYIDDGAKTMAMALDMLKVAENSGTTEVILTPHHLNGAFNNSSTAIRQSYDELRKQAHSAGIKLKLHLGSEVHLVNEAADQLIQGEAMTYCDHKKAALIEPPKRSMPPGYQSTLFKLLSSGITPVIAHPERNQFLRNNPAEVEHLVDIGCKVQITAQSITGAFGESIANASHDLLRKSLVHLVASDAHRVEGRSPNLLTAYRMISDSFDMTTADLLFKDNPKKLILGDELQAMGHKTTWLDIVLDSAISTPNELSTTKKNWWSKFFN